MKTIAVFVSGNGTNLQAIIDNIAKRILRVKLALVVSDQPGALALKRAKKAGVSAVFIDPKKFASKEDYEKYLVGLLKKEKVDWVVLAGFMRILGSYFLKKYKNRILNIHPALLPAFKGGCAIKDAFFSGVKVTGVTVHLVDEKVDHGPILAQEPVKISDSETVAQLEEKIHKVEHKLYSEVIAKAVAHAFIVKNRRIQWLSK